MATGSAGRKGIALTDRQRVAWLRLIRSDNVGPQTFRDLINHFGSAETALAMLPDLSARGGATRAIRIAGQSEAEDEIAALKRFGARLVGIGEPDYPQALREIDAAPPLIAVKGDLSVLHLPMAGLVGSRNCSVSGAKFAAMLARSAGEAGFATISGLARGIDAAVHQSTLKTGTVAVLAGGLDRPYPPENVALLDEIFDHGGAAISEMPFGWEPRARDFPRRNRLIAGCCLGLAVIEAADRSGSLITARFAADFGRLVFAVPGSPLDPRCHGTNRLIKDGATMLTSPDELVEALLPLVNPDLFKLPDVREPPRESDRPLQMPPDDSDRARIISALGPTPAEIDDLIRLTGIAPQLVYLVLLELDLAGRLERHAGGMVSLLSDGFSNRQD